MARYLMLRLTRSMASISNSIASRSRHRLERLRHARQLLHQIYARKQAAREYFEQLMKAFESAREDHIASMARITICG